MSTAQVLTPLDYAVGMRDGDVMSMVRTSLAKGQAQLAFHPVMTADKVPKVAFYEGLIRLRDSTGRIIPAHQFMNHVEENELGREIDCAALRLGIEMLELNPTLRLSINMSARSMADGKWRRTLDAGLGKGRRLAERLVFEISETSAMQLHEVMIRFMEELQPEGVCFALDDFGAGLTAFRYLKDFYFDMVKIDRCFIKGIQESPDNQVMTEALINVAHQFEMFAIAEGVETREEAELLRNLGVDCLQGYLFGVPKLTL